MVHHYALNKQPAKADHFTLGLTMAVKLDSAFIRLCLCEKKSNFLSWAIRTVFVNPITFNDYEAEIFIVAVKLMTFGERR